MRNLLFVLFLVAVSGLAAVGLLDLTGYSVRAAPAADGVQMCMKIATTGPIDVYFCETDYGDFYINSVGFMTAGD